MNLRLQAIMSDLWALQEQLKQRGALDGSWQPPSWNMQLPAPEAAALAEPAAPEETAAAPAGNHSPPAEPAAPPAKSRKRRARAAAATDTTEATAADGPAVTDTPSATAESSVAPKAKPRKRRAPAPALEHSERSEETEPVATEEAT
jgi:hypothetical protein